MMALKMETKEDGKEEEEGIMRRMRSTQITRGRVASRMPAPRGHDTDICHQPSFLSERRHPRSERKEEENDDDDNEDENGGRGGDDCEDGVGDGVEGVGAGEWGGGRGEEGRGGDGRATRRSRTLTIEFGRQRGGGGGATAG